MHAKTGFEKDLGSIDRQQGRKILCPGVTTRSNRIFDEDNRIGREQLVRSSSIRYLNAPTLQPAGWLESQSARLWNSDSASTGGAERTSVLRTGCPVAFSDAARLWHTEWFAARVIYLRLRYESSLWVKFNATSGLPLHAAA